MSSKLLKNRNKNRAALAFASVGAVGAAGALSVVSASADTIDVQPLTADTIDTNNAMQLAPNVTAGSFDLTKQATGEMYFPVQFDRPSGVNAAAIAGTVTQLGSSSSLYQSALASVPELADTQKMNSLLSDALTPSSSNYQSARETIVKLINWYNTLGGQKITTQTGEAYTASNLDKPINVLAIAFSNNNSINESATKTLEDINNAKTVADVEKALEAYVSGVSVPYNNAFDAYAAKVYADGADLNALSQYSAVKPVLDAYQNMYANGAAKIRTTLLDGQATSTEAGVTFFESAVIAGSTSDGGGDGSSSNKPNEDTIYTTKWVDEKGNALSPSTSNKTGYDAQKEFDGYTFKSVSTDDSTHTKTYVYTPKTPDEDKVSDTVWVDDKGNTLKPKEDGTHPDDGKTTLFPGYVIISSETTDENGVKHTVNTYHKIVSDTVWVDTDGKELKPKAEGEFPDKDGTAIPGYKLVDVTTNTDKNGDIHVINTYEKNADSYTKWVDENGNVLKPQESGNHPDTEGDDIPGYTLVSSKTDADGNTINTYKKDATKPSTYWFDTDGNTLKAKAEGQTLPDTDHNDIPGYTWTQTYTITEADLATGGLFAGTTFVVGDTINIYEKTTDKKVTTTWVDTDGKTLKAPAEGAYPDTDGNDIPGYTLVSTKTDADGNVVNTYKKDETTPSTDVTTKWVDEDGKTLKPQESGSHPDTEGDDIPGYTLVQTNTDANGNVTNVYKPNTSKVVTSWIDSNGNRLAADETGDDFGKQASFNGYKFVGVKMSEDGKHKYYIYEKEDTTTPTTTTPTTTTPSTTSSAKSIPQTGLDDAGSGIAKATGAGLLASLGALGIFGLGKRRKNLKDTNND